MTVWDKAARRLLGAIPRQDEQREEARLFSPVNLALDREGNLYVSDLGAFRVQKYDREGRFLRSFGSPGLGARPVGPPQGHRPGRGGPAVRADAATEVVQIFDPEGRLLLFFGEPGGGAFELSLPAKVCGSITSSCPVSGTWPIPPSTWIPGVLVTSQYGERKISVFGVGRRKG